VIKIVLLFLTVLLILFLSIIIAILFVEHGNKSDLDVVDLPKPTKLPAFQYTSTQNSFSTTMTKRSKFKEKSNYEITKIPIKTQHITTQKYTKRRRPNKNRTKPVGRTFKIITKNILPARKYGQVDHFDICENMARNRPQFKSKKFNLFSHFGENYVGEVGFSELRFF
jgi:hypothetical protein